MSDETRAWWMVAVAAALVVAVCVTIVLLALAMHPSMTLEPANL